MHTQPQGKRSAPGPAKAPYSRGQEGGCVGASPKRRHSLQADSRIAGKPTPAPSHFLQASLQPGAAKLDGVLPFQRPCSLTPRGARQAAGALRAPPRLLPGAPRRAAAHRPRRQPRSRAAVWRHRAQPPLAAGRPPARPAGRPGTGHRAPPAAALQLAPPARPRVWLCQELCGAVGGGRRSLLLELPLPRCKGAKSRACKRFAISPKCSRGEILKYNNIV